MKSLSMKVMTLLMAALFLSASGCSNANEMSSPEGTVKGCLKAIEQLNYKKMVSYIDPREKTEEDMQAASELTRVMRKSGLKGQFTDIKTTLVSKKESVVLKGDKWRRVKNENATVEARLRRTWCDESDLETIRLNLWNKRWYIEHFKTSLILEDESQAKYNQMMDQ